MSLVVEIPDSVALYQQRILGFGKAAELAGMTREHFAVELTKRNIPRHYTKEDLALDEAYGSFKAPSSRAETRRTVLYSRDG